MTASPRSPESRPTVGYVPPTGVYDEAFAPDGTPRPHYEPVVERLGTLDLRAVGAAVDREVHRRGVAFNTGGGPDPFRLDPVPRILSCDEWEVLEAGLVQRVRALNQFVGDAYGDRRMVAAGRIPERVLEEAAHREPLMREVSVAHGVYVHVAGLDVVRGADGRLAVLEDNLRTPSGLAYALAARAVTDAVIDDLREERAQRAPVGPHELQRALRLAAPVERDDPVVIMLGDGPAASARFEHETLARLLELPLVEPRDLEQRGSELHARIDGRRVRVDVIYRRTDEDRLDDPNGPTPLGELLLEPLRRGTLACVNAFGTGLADDKLVHAYVEDMVRFFLDEEPILASVPTYDLAEPDVRADALARLEELVVKPREGYGGHGVVVCAHATADDRTAARRAIQTAPERFVAQETVMLSTHPTVHEGRLEPRHVDLRPFVITARDDVSVVPGGLTRVALARGALVVNSSQAGGAKDTWVLR